MKLVSLILVLLFIGCAQTRVYENGQLVAVIQGDATNVTINTGRTRFHADTLNHSQATMAGGKVVGGILGQLSGLATLLRAILPFFP